MICKKTKTYNRQRCNVKNCHKNDLCNYSASASLLVNEKNYSICIQLGIECAVICYATLQFMSLGSQKVLEFCLICAAMCEEYTVDCIKFDIDHSKETASARKLCTIKCQRLKQTFEY